jgi:hemoglobin-like flavoprotein
VPNQQVIESFARCEANGDFAEDFYATFLATSAEVAELFAGTDFTKQRKILRASVYLMISRDLDDPGARATMERIGGSHSRARLDIRPELYEDWLESVCSTVAKLDPEWGNDVEAAWRSTLSPGIDLITSFYAA